MTLSDVIGLIETYMVGRLLSLEQAVEQVRPIVGNDALLEEAHKDIRRRIGVIEDLRDPATVARRRFVPWYPGPSASDCFWPRVRDYFLDQKGWSSEVVDSIDRASSKVIAQLPCPAEARFSGRGLVLGYVQSGKTANFTAVASKAADVGFRLIIVLSGLTNSLRRQTQIRMESDLIARLPERWLSWTTADQDIGDIPMGAAGLLGAADRRNIAIVKKNAYRLRRLIRMLADANEPILRTCPVLVIDDECDQASVNSARLQEERTRINQLLIELLQLLPKVAYVGYTATPYANVLVDPNTPEDLYPRDFIIDLPRPVGYFGAERLFGRNVLDSDMSDEGIDDGLDMIRHIPEDEEALLRPSRNDKDTWAIRVTPSLRQALFYFWMAASARVARGQTGQPSAMLIHTTQYVAAHNNSKRPLEAFWREVMKQLEDGDPHLIAELRKLWEAEAGAVDSAQFGLTPVPFEAVQQNLPETLSCTRFFVENGQSDERLEPYDGPAIVIGGNVLARGLTIEGLICSFFLRTTSMYDSLMQMGRWFGYRFGYEDLPRVWMTPEMEADFRDLATVEHEIRQDIARYSEDGTCTPSDVGVRIRLHPRMEVTAKTKQQAGKIIGLKSFDSEVIQTTRFRTGDRAWLEHNLEAGRALVSAAHSLWGEPDASRPTGYVYRRVSWEIIREFLATYRIHEGHGDFRAEQVLEYVQQQNRFEPRPLAYWNIAVVRSTVRGASVHPRFGPLQSIPMVVRSARQEIDSSSIDIGALLTRAHAALDFPDGFAGPQSTWADLKKARGPVRKGEPKPAVEEPLLLLYLIDKNSEPRGADPTKKGLTRRALAAPVDVLGIGIVFPSTKHPTPVQYITAPVGARFAGESLEDEELGLEDDADEQTAR